MEMQRNKNRHDRNYKIAIERVTKMMSIAQSIVYRCGETLVFLETERAKGNVLHNERAEVSNRLREKTKDR